MKHMLLFDTYFFLLPNLCDIVELGMEFKVVSTLKHVVTIIRFSKLVYLKYAMTLVSL